MNNKRFIIIYILLVVISIIVYLFFCNNYFLYKQPIAKVIEEKSIYQSTESITYGYEEKVYIQKIKAKILNGTYKGKIVNIENEYHQGEAYDIKYHVKDEIFLDLNIRNKKIVKASITEYKRDKYVVLLLLFLILVIILVGRIKGLLSIMSIIINIVIFYIIIKINAKGVSLPILAYISSILFSTVCLLLVSGFNKKTKSAVISSIVGVTVTTILVLVIIFFTKYEGIRFEQMELLTRPAEDVFIAEVIIGGLGAIMDISITMSSSLNELIEKNKRISNKKLYQSGINIGKDVMSTMINVLFFTFISSSITNLAIYFRNGIEVKSLLNEFISLEMTRALIGAIGIVLTIPIAIKIFLLVYRRKVD